MVNERPLNKRNHAVILDIFNKPTTISNAEIYMKHYPRVKDITVAAQSVSRLLKKVNSQELLNKLRAEAEERAISESVATLLERKQVLTEIIRGRLSDVMDKDGNIDVTGDSLKSAAIAEYRKTVGHSEKKDSDWETATIKLRDPIAAVRELNSMEGIGGDRINIDNRSLHLHVGELTDDDLERIIEGNNSTTGSRRITEAKESP